MVSDPDTLDALIDASLHVLGIPIAPEWRPGIRTHLEISLGHAGSVASFALPDEAEPAPVFRA